MYAGAIIGGIGLVALCYFISWLIDRGTDKAADAIGNEVLRGKNKKHGQTLIYLRDLYPELCRGYVPQQTTPAMNQMPPVQPQPMQPKPMQNQAAPVQPVQPVQPVKPVQPVQQVKPVQPVQQARPVQPVQQARPVQPVQQAKPVQPVQQVRPVQQAKPVQQKPVQQVRPVQQAKPVQQKPVQRQGAPAGQAAGWKCIVCGTMNPGLVDICKNCGNIHA